MIRFLSGILNKWQNRESLKLGGKARSPHWGSFKREFEKKNPKQCAVCGDKQVQLHHRLPFHLDPSKELDENNVIWLCEGEGTLNHHRGHGHLGSFQSFNKDVVEDAEIWKKKIDSRP